MAENRVQIVIDTDSQGAVTGIRQVSGEMDRFSNSSSGAMRRVDQSANVLRNSLHLLFSTLAAWQTARFVSGFIETAAQFEKIEISLRTLTGSSQRAQEAMSWITDFTARTPYELQQVADAFTRLTAFGLDPTKSLQMLGDAAGSMGKTLMQAVEMYTDAITMEFERLKEFGVRASQEKDRIVFAFSVAGKDMHIVAKKTQQDVSAALNEIFRRFEGGMQKQSESWTGIMSNMSDSWTLFRKEVMDSEGLFAIAKTGVNELYKEVQRLKDEGKLKEWATEAALGVIAAFQSMAKAAVGFYAIIQSIRGAWYGLQIAVKEYRLEGLQKSLTTEQQLPGVGGLPIGPILNNLAGLNSPEAAMKNLAEQQKLYGELGGLYKSLQGTQEKTEAAIDFYDSLVTKINALRAEADKATPPVEAATQSIQALGGAISGPPSKVGGGGGGGKGPLDLSALNQSIDQFVSAIAGMKKDLTDLQYDLEIEMAKAAGEGFRAEQLEIEKWAKGVYARAYEEIAKLESRYREMLEKLSASKQGATPEAQAAVASLRAQLDDATRIAQQQVDVVNKLADAKERIARAEADERVARLNVQYAELTGTLEEQTRAQLELLELEKQRALAAAKTDKEQELILAVYREQARQLKVMNTGSFIEGFGEALRKWESNSLVSEAKAGKMAFDALIGSIDGAADALAEFTMTGKMDFADFANSIIKDLIRMMYQALLTKAVSSIFNLVFPSFGGGGGNVEGVAGWLGEGVKLGWANGGVTTFLTSPVGMASGGVVSRKTLAWVGEGSHKEAVVPLPDGRHIPAIVTGQGQPELNVHINVENQTGAPVKARQSSARMDGKKYVVGVILEDYQNGGDIWKMIRGQG